MNRRSRGAVYGKGRLKDCFQTAFSSWHNGDINRTSDPITLCPAFGVVRTELDGEAVEDAVDEFVAVGTAEGFGHFDGFIDDDGVGRFGHGAQFVAGHQ